MATKTIRIADDYTKYPTVRYRRHGRGSGEGFRDELLIPALEQYEKVIVILDGVAGYPASFLEEAFGGLIRKGYKLHDIMNKLEIKAETSAYEPYASLAEEYIKRADKIYKQEAANQ